MKSIGVAQLKTHLSRPFSRITPASRGAPVPIGHALRWMRRVPGS